MNFIDLQAQYQSIKGEVDRRIHAVLDHGRYILGPEVQEMEAALAAYTGAKHCVAVASGTDALLIALMAAGIGPGDEVITTPFSFVATAEVIVLCGAKPVFADIEPDTCLIDPARIAEKITPATKAIIPVSLYGQAADMDEINALAEKHGILVIEDAAQSFGAAYRERRSCNLSSIACTSFFPSKPLGCYGDGGALFTDNDDIAKLARQIRVHGDESRYRHVRLGVAGRMDSIQCAVILAKLGTFDWELEQRARIAARYEAGLRGVAQTIRVKQDRSSVHAQYTIMTERRDELQQKLSAQGIPTAIHYPLPIDHQPAYAHLAGEACEASLAASRIVISLPMSPFLSAEDQDRVIDAVKAVLAG
ncbi:MAG: DegT/DnrJ/EryC1/StrS family aminotransferase [Rhizobiaceae bacterium]